ncbi:hypothetical protein I4U23_010719 [Adineta vaga]|nr:hypothetical protein I4U23_010719 [Adineta vaga]
MLSFIRKRLPSKDRSDEHLQHVKSNKDDSHINRSQSNDELSIDNNGKKKQKKKKKNTIKSSSTLNVLDTSSPIENQSYSDVDYFPMMASGTLSQSVNQNTTSSSDRSSLSDCYFNPSEVMQNIPDLKYVQPVIGKPRVFEIPVIDCRANYKDIDHKRTKALRDVTEQRNEKRSTK